MIICVGELLADAVTENGGERMRAGGAPFNVACDVTALGGDAGFYGCVGKDDTGRFLLERAEACGFRALAVSLSGRATTKAYVKIGKNGEREFTFDASHTADCDLDIEVFKELLSESNDSGADIVHFGSLMLRDEEGRDFVREAAAYARARGAWISFDVNLRVSLYPSVSEAVSAALPVINAADIIKLSEDEARLFVPSAADARLAALSLASGGKTVFVTLGERGAYAARGDECVFSLAEHAEAVDATGAGDAFFAAALLSLERTSDLKAALAAGISAGAAAVALPRSNLL